MSSKATKDVLEHIKRISAEHKVALERLALK
jgi:hypothetical protein